MDIATALPRFLMNHLEATVWLVGLMTPCKSDSADYEGEGELPQLVDVAPGVDCDAGQQEADEEYPPRAESVDGGAYYQGQRAANDGAHGPGKGHGGARPLELVGDGLEEHPDGGVDLRPGREGREEDYPYYHPPVVYAAASGGWLQLTSPTSSGHWLSSASLISRCSGRSR